MTSGASRAVPRAIPNRGVGIETGSRAKRCGEPLSGGMCDFPAVCPIATGAPALAEGRAGVGPPRASALGPHRAKRSGIVCGGVRAEELVQAFGEALPGARCRPLEPPGHGPREPCGRPARRLAAGVIRADPAAARASRRFSGPMRMVGTMVGHGCEPRSPQFRPPVREPARRRASRLRWRQRRALPSRGGSIADIPAAAPLLSADAVAGKRWPTLSTTLRLRAARSPPTSTASCLSTCHRATRTAEVVARG